jgi:vitamin B12 transporter
LGSLELAISGPPRWNHRLVGFNYTQRRTNLDGIEEPGRFDPVLQFNIDTPFHAIDNFNRAGFDYQGTYTERSWAVSTLGYEFEDEHGRVGDLVSNSISEGLRRNQALFGQQILTFPRASLVAGGRFVDNESFGEKFVPAGTLTLLALEGGRIFSGTRLIFQYAEGIKEPSFAESFGNGGSFPTLPNPQLKPEQTRALGAGLEQNLGASYSLAAQYFNNLFRNKIDFNLFPCFCQGQYVNVNEAMAHGAEVTFKGRPTAHLSFALGYAYTSTQILKQPFAFDPLLLAGRPLVRRPKHSATGLIRYLGSRGGAELGASFVGRRPDSDFLGFGFDHTPGYVLATAGGWFKLNSRLTAYAQLENLLDRFYEEVIGYPSLGANFRAGMRFRVGGE